MKCFNPVQSTPDPIALSSTVSISFSQCCCVPDPFIFSGSLVLLRCPSLQLTRPLLPPPYVILLQPFCPHPLLFFGCQPALPSVLAETPGSKLTKTSSKVVKTRVPLLQEAHHSCGRHHPTKQPWCEQKRKRKEPNAGRGGDVR